MISITGYGGVNEIGGNKFVIQDEKSKIMLDFGLSFGTANKYLDEFLQPRKLNGLGDYYELGLLPKLKGIYREDYIKHMGNSEEPLEYDALFLTHAHADHASYVHFLRADLPIYGSAETLAIMKSIEDTGSTANLDLITLTKSFQQGKTRDGRPKRLDSREPEMIIKRPINKMNGKVNIGDFEMEPITVNHSLLGAIAFVIKSPKGDIAFSGDVRFHGRGGHFTENFVKKARNVKYLMIEGTRIDKQDTKSEVQVEAEIRSIIRNTKGLVLANWPSRDTDRLWSFYNATVQNDRKLVISSKQAYLIEELAKEGADVPNINSDHIRIFVSRKYWGFLGSNASKEEIEKDYSFAKWEIPYLYHKNMVNYKDLRNDYSKYVLRADLFDMTELIDIKPPENSIYIRSVVEPFDDEMKVSEEKLDNWLKLFKLEKVQTHCSGHAPGPDLLRIVDEIDPEFVIPIHTTHPEKFRDLGPKWINPEVGRAIEI